VVLGVADISSLTDGAAMTDGLSIVPAVQLANGITQAMPDGAIHAQGNFVVLKLLEVAEPIDCMSLAGALLPAALRITGEKNKTFHGLEIMLKLVFKIVSTANSLLETVPSATCAGQLCVRRIAKSGCPMHMPSVIMHVLSAVVLDAQAGMCIL
jgi:hypothetical protein